MENSGGFLRQIDDEIGSVKLRTKVYGIERNDGINFYLEVERWDTAVNFCGSISRESLYIASVLGVLQKRELDSILEMQMNHANDFTREHIGKFLDFPMDAQSFCLDEESIGEHWAFVTKAPNGKYFLRVSIDRPATIHEPERIIENAYSAVRLYFYPRLI